MDAQPRLTPEHPKIKRRSFAYQTGLAWTHGRMGTLSSASKPPMTVSSPPEFKGEPGYWTPEDLFVAAVEMCQMLTFIGLAQKQELAFVSYRSNATGTLEFIDGQYRFTRVVIEPTVTIEDASAEAGVQAALREAHKRCLIANSITAVVEVNAVVVVQETVDGHFQT